MGIRGVGLGKIVKVSIQTLGCKLNQAESERLARELVKAGYILVPPSEKADICLLNSCTVTNIADRKARQALRNLREVSPGAVIIATGCYAERAPDELRRIEGVKYAFGNKEKTKLVERLVSLEPALVPDDAGRVLKANLRTRAFISIQDGCSNFCAYCIVPYVRGKEKSRPAGEVTHEIKDLVNDGYKEVVLTGTEIGAYSFEGSNLMRLVERILSETATLRLRLSSLQPQELTPELLGLWRDPRLCRDFHISLQSGSDEVLKRMRRHYTTGEYRNAVSMIRSSAGGGPEAAVTTDVIVGFPGETAAEFAESCDFSKEMRFARIHVFAYSPRPGTTAASMPAQIEGKIKKERSRQMLALSKESVKNFLAGFIGKTLTVLWEQVEGDEIWSGLTDNYIRVYIKSSDDLTNKLTDVKLTKLYRDGMEAIP